MVAEDKGKKAKKSSSSKKTQSDRVLMHPEEWKDPAERKVISEYHKDGSQETPAGSMSESEKGSDRESLQGGSADLHREERTTQIR